MLKQPNTGRNLKRIEEDDLLSHFLSKQGERESSTKLFAVQSVKRASAAFIRASLLFKKQAYNSVRKVESVLESMRVGSILGGKELYP